MPSTLCERPDTFALNVSAGACTECLPRLIITAPVPRGTSVISTTTPTASRKPAYSAPLKAVSPVTGKVAFPAVSTPEQHIPSNSRNRAATLEGSGVDAVSQQPSILTGARGLLHSLSDIVRFPSGAAVTAAARNAAEAAAAAAVAAAAAAAETSVCPLMPVSGASSSSGSGISEPSPGTPDRPATRPLSLRTSEDPGGCPSGSADQPTALILESQRSSSSPLALSSPGTPTCFTTAGAALLKWEQRLMADRDDAAAAWQAKRLAVVAATTATATAAEMSGRARDVGPLASQLTASGSLGMSAAQLSLSGGLCPAGSTGSTSSAAYSDAPARSATSALSSLHPAGLVSSFADFSSLGAGVANHFTDDVHAQAYAYASASAPGGPVRFEYDLQSTGEQQQVQLQPLPEALLLQRQGGQWQEPQRFLSAPVALSMGAASHASSTELTPASAAAADLAQPLQSATSSLLAYATEPAAAVIAQHTAADMRLAAPQHLYSVSCPPIRVVNPSQPLLQPRLAQLKVCESVPVTGCQPGSVSRSASTSLTIPAWSPRLPASPCTSVASPKNDGAASTPASPCWRVPSASMTTQSLPPHLLQMCSQEPSPPRAARPASVLAPAAATTVVSPTAPRPSSLPARPPLHPPANANATSRVGGGFSSFAGLLGQLLPEALHKQLSASLSPKSVTYLVNPYASAPPTASMQSSSIVSHEEPPAPPSSSAAWLHRSASFSPGSRNTSSANLAALDFSTVVSAASVLSKASASVNLASLHSVQLHGAPSAMALPSTATSPPHSPPTKASNQPALPLSPLRLTKSVHHQNLPTTRMAPSSPSRAAKGAVSDSAVVKVHAHASSSSVPSTMHASPRLLRIAVHSSDPSSPVAAAATAAASASAASPAGSNSNSRHTADTNESPFAAVGASMAAAMSGMAASAAAAATAAAAAAAAAAVASGCGRSPFLAASLLPATVSADQANVRAERLESATGTTTPPANAASAPAQVDVVNSPKAATLAKVQVVAAVKAVTAASSSAEEPSLPVLEVVNGAKQSPLGCSMATSAASLPVQAMNTSLAHNSRLRSVDSAQALGPSPYDQGYYGVLCVPRSCPASMQRTSWSMEDYTILTMLYSGYMSKVFLAECKATRVVLVLKVYRHSKLDVFHMHLVKREVDIHARLCHGNIIGLYAAFQEGEDIVLVQECAEKGDLFQLLKHRAAVLTESQAVTVLRPLLYALSYLHDMGIVHRDLKPENIMVTADGTFKLGDFGVSLDTRAERPVSRAGTLDYMPPEVMRCPPKALPTENKERLELQYSTSVDVWALGVLAFELLTGFPPFSAGSWDEQESNVKNTEPKYPHKLSPAGRSFISGCLTKDPNRRPTMANLLDHPWINPNSSRRTTRENFELAHDLS